MINSIIELILLPILLPISIIWVCYKNSNNKDSNKLDNLSNKEENNNNISISNETKICDSSKVKRTYESNRNTDYIHVVNQYDTVMFTYDDMKKEYQKIYYGDHNSAKLNNLIVNDIKNNPIKDKKIKEVNQIYEFTYLTLYLNKSNQELIKDDQINYQLLGINKLSAPYLLIDEDYTNNLYIKFIYEDTTSKDYSNTIFKLLEYCHNDTYFTLGYSEESYKYKFLYNNNQVNLENYNIDNFNNDILTIKDNFLKNYNIISRYLFYVGFENYDEIPYNIQPDIHYEDIVEIFNKFKNNEQFKITDLPYLNEINDILSYISTKIINVFNLQNPLSLIKIDSKKKRFNQELHQTYSLRIYLSNTYRFLINEKDELDYNKLGIDKLDLNLYLDDEEARFIICVDDTSNKNFSKLLLVLFKYCQDEMFAIYGYEDIDTYYKYKFVFCNKEVCIEDYSFNDLKDMYNSLKNEIINRFDILNDKLIFIQDNEFENYNPNEDFDYDDFLELVTNLKECLELTILELPVMEEANYSLKQMEEQIDRLYVSEKNRDLYNIWHIDKPKNYSSSKKERIKPYKENKLSWEEEKFNKEADLWGLSEEDRRIAKQERMSPAEFIEAEERDDDELDTDEWEN